MTGRCRREPSTGVAGRRRSTPSTPSSHPRSSSLPGDSTPIRPSRSCTRCPTRRSPTSSTDSAPPPNMLWAVIVTAHPEVRAIIRRRPTVETAPPRDFAPRGVLEMIVHTHDISTGLGIPFDPPRESLQSAAHTRATGPRTRSSRLTTADPTSEPAAVGRGRTDQELLGPRYRSSTSCMCNRLASWRGSSRRPSNPLDFIPTCTRPTFS